MLLLRFRLCARPTIFVSLAHTASPYDRATLKAQLREAAYVYKGISVCVLRARMFVSVCECVFVCGILSEVEL